MIRCELSCGHTAFALRREARQVARGYFFCYAHDGFVRILAAEPLALGPPSARRKRTRRVRSERAFVE